MDNAASLASGRAAHTDNEVYMPGCSPIGEWPPKVDIAPLNPIGFSHSPETTRYASSEVCSKMRCFLA
jgi:hypothetical protein